MSATEAVDYDRQMRTVVEQLDKLSAGDVSKEGPASSLNKEFKMRSSFIHHISIIRLAALALLALCLVRPQVRAQEGGSFVFHTISWGIGYGQTTRFTVFNPNEPSERERRTVFVQVTLLDARGAVIAQSDEIAILPGAFRSIDFNRDDLSLAGEPGTGRVQTRAQVRYRTFSIVDRTQLTIFSPSIELIDNNTGGTTAVWVTVGFFEVAPAPKPQ